MTVTSCQRTYALNSSIVGTYPSYLEDNTDHSIKIKEAKKTANSYIVPPNTILIIPVNVRGNGGDVANTGISTSINPSSVGILWQTSPDLITLGDINADKKVSITANSESGNAVIAAYSGDGQTGDILWSWHIWVTDYDPSKGKTYTITNSAGASYTFMDRDLGALSSVCCRDRYWSSASYCNTGYYLFFNRLSVEPEHNTSKAFGFSIRCVKE